MSSLIEQFSKEEWAIRKWRNSRQSHEMFIYGYLECAQNFMFSFGLESTAAYILKASGIDKDDFIRVCKKDGHEVEKTLELIEKAFQLK